MTYSGGKELAASDITNVNFPELVQKAAAEEAKPRVAMPPGGPAPSKSRFEMLLSPKEHEMHHRGQLMVLQRIPGLTPHLTRQMQERFAQRQAAQPQAHR